MSEFDRELRRTHLSSLLDRFVILPDDETLVVLSGKFALEARGEQIISVWEVVEAKRHGRCRRGDLRVRANDEIAETLTALDRDGRPFRVRMAYIDWWPGTGE